MVQLSQAVGRSQPFVTILPPPIISERAPASSDTNYPKGMEWLDESVSPPVMYQHTGGGVWNALANTTAELASPPAIGSSTPNAGTFTDLAATQLQIDGGAATDFIGQATLASGTVTIANTNIADTDRIFLTRADANSSTALGELTITAQTADTSFVITALDPSDGSSTITGDTSIVNYVIIRQY